MKATLKIKALTDKVNGYGMPVVLVDSDTFFDAPNVGHNTFVPSVEIDETDLLRLRTMFNTFSTETVMLEISMPNRETTKPVWYNLTGRDSDKTFLQF